MASCRKKKSDDAGFLEDLRDHIDEFINASVDEHKTCFQKTLRKVKFSVTMLSGFVFPRNWISSFLNILLLIGVQMFGMSKIVAEKNASEIESSLPLQTTVYK